MLRFLGLFFAWKFLDALEKVLIEQGKIDNQTESDDDSFDYIMLGDIINDDNDHLGD